MTINKEYLRDKDITHLVLLISRSITKLSYKHNYDARKIRADVVEGLFKLDIKGVQDDEGKNVL